MSEFFNLNNNSFDLSKLGQIRKEDIEKLGDKKLFAIFNAINLNGDDIIDSSEISLFIDKLKEYDKNTDGDISKKEFKQFFKANKGLFGGNKVDIDSVAEIFNISISNSEQQLSVSDEFVFDFDNNVRSEDDIKDATIDFLFDEFRNGMAMLEGFDEGCISKGYNAIKEILGSNLSKSNVARVLYMKNETAELLRKAHNNELTASEYYNILKKNLITIFPGVENFSEEQKTQLNEYVNGVDENGLRFLIREALKIPNSDSPYYEEALKQFSETFEAVAITKNTTTVYTSGEFTSFSTSTEYVPHETYEPENGERLITFEEVFRDSFGRNYSTRDFERLEDAKSEYMMTVSVYAKADRIHELLDKQININKANNAYGVDPFQEKMSMRALEGAIFSALRELGATTPEEQLELLKDFSGYNNIKFKEFKDGEFPDFNEPMIQNESSIPMNSYTLTNIAQKFLAKIDENRDANCPKNPEWAANTLETRYAVMFGDDDVETIVQAYINEQESFVQGVRTGVEIVGGAAAIIGMFVCTPLALAGAAVGAVGGVGIEALNEVTKNEFTKERKDELLQELTINVALIAAGGVAGRAGMAAKAALIAKNCPRLVACIADIGLDSTLSLLADYALMGQLNIEGEGFSQALALIAGHIKAGKFGKRKLSRQDVDPMKNPAFNSTVANLAKDNPKLYQDFQLLRSKNLLPHSALADFSYNPKSATFSKQFLDDVSTMAQAVRSGVKPVDAFVPKYKSVVEASASRKIGEVFSIEGTNDVYYVSSKGAQKLDMDRDMYFNLFPPLRSAVTQQGQIGNCYFVSGILDGCMSNPEAKAMLLSKIHQNGNDITVDLGTYEPYIAEHALDKLPYSITFKDAKKHSSLYHNQGISGAQGLKLVEQAYGYKLVAERFADRIQQKYQGQPEKQITLLEELGELFANPKAKPSKELAEAMEYAYGQSYNRVGANFWGRLAISIDDIEALRHKAIGFGGDSSLSFRDFFDLSSDAAKYVDLNEADAYRSNPNILMFVSTNVPDSQIKEQLSLFFQVGDVGKGQVAGNHAFRIADVDNVNKTVSVVNPWDTSKVVTFSKEKFEDLFSTRIEILDISMTGKVAQSPHLISLLKNLELDNVSPQGRYYSNEEMLNKYFKEKKIRNGLEYPERKSLCCDDEEFFKLFRDNPYVKAAAEKFKDWEFKPYIHMIVESIGEGVNVEAVTRAISNAADNQDVIGKRVLELILSWTKSEKDYIFMLEQAPDIAQKLRAKGFDDIKIYQTLSHLSCENYPYLKELWE